MNANTVTYQFVTHFFVQVMGDYLKTGTSVIMIKIVNQAVISSTMKSIFNVLRSTGGKQMLSATKHKSETYEPRLVRVKDTCLSLEQYGWLFSDLQPFDVVGLEQHYVEFGENELLTDRRRPEQDRLMMIKLQNLSDHRFSAPTHLWKLIPRDMTAKLTVIFSHTHIPVGKFAMSHAMVSSQCSVLYLNTILNDWYQSGICGLTKNVNSTAALIMRNADLVGADHIETIGSSMGAYAAILMGHLVNAKKIIAIDPEFIVGGKKFRSWIWNKRKYYDEKYRSILPITMSMKDRLCLFQSSIDPIEAEWYSMSIKNGISSLGIALPHGGAASIIDWKTYNLSSVLGVTNSSHVHSPYDFERLIEMAKMHSFCINCDYMTALDLCENISVSHPALCAYESILNFFVGRAGKAVSSFERFCDFARPAGLHGFRDFYYDLTRFGISSDKQPKITGEVLESLSSAFQADVKSLVGPTA